MSNFLIGCVGKPSAGKSSFLNAATDANAKVGNYPFTTIEPNHGVTFFQSPCPCARFSKKELCGPRYGKCADGIRHIPIQMLDVAGLVPGASEGRGLGNKFLDDLRHAHVLLHIIDAAGKTNEKGEETTGYDPMKDIDWLTTEIHSWIFNNLWKKWGSIVRRHTHTKSFAAITLQLQLSGYGAHLPIVQRTLDKLGIKEPASMETWDEEMVHKLVSQFMKERFPTILVLNKIDLSDADNNIARICKKYDMENIVLTSALAECFLKKMEKDGYIRYISGSDNFTLAEDEELEKTSLKIADAKIKQRLEKIRDLILFRYGTTGVADVIKKAVEVANLIPVYPVKNIHNFTCDGSKSIFRDCLLTYPGTTIREFCKQLSGEMDKHFLFAEGVDGRRLGEDEEITYENNIIKFTTAATETSNVTHKESKTENNLQKTKDPKQKGSKEEE